MLMLHKDVCFKKSFDIFNSFPRVFFAHNIVFNLLMEFLAWYILCVISLFLAPLSPIGTPRYFIFVDNKFLNFKIIQSSN